MKLTSQSIQSKFLYPTLILIVSLFVVLGVFLIFNNRAAIESTLDQKNNSIADIVGRLSSDYFTVFDFTDFKKLAKAISSDPEVEFFAIYNENRELLIAEPEIPADKSSLLVYERDILDRERNRLGSISIGYNRDTVNRNAVTSLIITVGGMTVALLVMSVGIIMIVNRITKPLTELTDTAKALGSGDLDRRTNITSGDELGTLAASFNKMADDIQYAITTIESSLHEKEILLREVHHRVKNNMQIISSLLKIQTEHIKDEETLELFTESRNRIRSMALIHENLYKSENLASINFKHYVEALTGTLRGSFGNLSRNVRFTIDMDDISLNADTAIACGLIINELVSNSIKHAFPENRNGEIRIAFNRNDSGELELTVADDGIGMPGDIDFRKVGSLGMELVVLLSEKQLGGKIEINTVGGTEVLIRFREIQDKKRV